MFSVLDPMFMTWLLFNLNFYQALKQNAYIGQNNNYYLKPLVRVETITTTTKRVKSYDQI